MNARVPRFATGAGQLGQLFMGIGDARKAGQESAYDTMGSAYKLGYDDQQNRFNQYQNRNDQIYNRMMARPNLFRNNQQENFRNDALRSYLSNYTNPNIARLAQSLPGRSQLDQRQLEDLRNLSFADASYLPTDAFNELYGNQGQSNLGMELGLPENGLMQSGASGGRSINTRANTEFDQNLDNSARILNQIQNELAKKAHSQSSMSGMQKFGAGLGLVSALLGMANPFALG